MSIIVTFIKKFIEHIIDYKMQSIFRRCEKLFKIISKIVQFINYLNH